MNRERGGERGGCSGHCQAQEYQVKASTGTSITVRPDPPSETCPPLTEREVQEWLDALFPVVALIPCRGGGEGCHCVPRAVKDDDPSWSRWINHRLKEPIKKSRAYGDEKLCHYTISGSVLLRSRIDDDAICISG